MTKHDLLLGHLRALRQLKRLFHDEWDEKGRKDGGKVLTHRLAWKKNREITGKMIAEANIRTGGLTNTKWNCWPFYRETP